MNTIFAIVLIAILATGVIATSFQNVYAVKADNSNKLTPKSFGEKTKTKITVDDSQKTQKTSYESIKKEQVKVHKKIVEQYKAKELAKTIYR